MQSTRDLAHIRAALLAAVALIDRLADPRSRSIDQQVLDLLHELPDGLTTKAITALVRRRRVDTIAAIRLLAAANQIKRNERGRWVLVQEALG